MRQRHPERIDLLDGRGPHQIDALGFAQLEILRFIARVMLEILRLSELQRVHEHRDRDVVGVRARSPQQRPMPLVQRAHRRHEADGRAVVTPSVGGRARGRHIADHVHRSSTSTTRARSA